MDGYEALLEHDGRRGQPPHRRERLLQLLLSTLCLLLFVLWSLSNLLLLLLLSLDAMCSWSMVVQACGQRQPSVPPGRQAQRMHTGNQLSLASASLPHPLSSQHRSDR